MTALTWIKSEREQPNDWERVYVLVRGQAEEVKAYYVRGAGWLDWQHRQLWGVTHWLRLPQQPLRGKAELAYCDDRDRPRKPLPNVSDL